MSRTRLFKRIKRCMKIAAIANKRGLTESELNEALAKVRYEMDRRQFLKQSLAAGGIALAASLPIPRKAFAVDKRMDIDPVLIIGGGAAGLAAAYQLNKAGVRFQICDWSTRLGGRIRTSKQINNSSNQFVELGAELVDSNHYTLLGIAQELGVEIEDFSEYDNGLVKELFYFNGQTYTEEDFIHAVRPLLEKISVANADIYGDVDEYINAKNAELMPNSLKYDNISLKQFLDDNSADTDPWVMNAVNVAYLCEYGMETEQQSSINLIDLIDTDTEDGFSLFGDSDESKRVKGGNEVLIKAIISHLGLQENRDYLTNAKLTAIREGSNDTLSCVFDVKGTFYTKSARNVICTLPFSTLREVEGLKRGSKVLAGVDPKKIDCINDLGYGTNTKMMMSFDLRFWRNSDQAVPANTGSLYSDFTSQTFWETSRLQPGNNGILTNFTGGKRGLEVAQDPKKAREQALADLGQVYGSQNVTSMHDGKVAVMPWPIIPQTKGSYACPTVGQYTTIWGYNADTEANGRLFFAGEHTHPLTYGFMNGAYNSGCRAAEGVLTKLDISAPEIPGRNLISEDAEDGDN